jgi:predicted Zn-dependent peptidase
MIVTAGIKNEDKSTAESEIMLQLEEMKKGNISSEEFECAKKSLKNSYKAIYDSPAALGHWYLIRSLNGSSQSPLEILETLDNVTIEDVKNLAKKVSLDTIYFMRGTESNIQGDECDE